MLFRSLKNLYESLGFEEVITYAQSGNVVFRAEECDTKLLAQKLSVKIKEVFEFDVDVIVKTINEYRLIVDKNPLVKYSDKNLSSMYVTFLSSIPVNIDLKAIEAKKSEDEEVVIINDVVYLFCPRGYGKTKLTNNFFESKLKVVATTRNWKTVNALLEIALLK